MELRIQHFSRELEAHIYQEKSLADCHGNTLIVKQSQNNLDNLEVVQKKLLIGIRVKLAPNIQNEKLED